jgi:acetyl-CoA carboxylase biotin carboxyl carrier protein
VSEGLLPEEVAAILRVADEVDFTELSLRSGDTTITLRRGGQEVTAPSVLPAATPRSAAPVPATAEPPLAAAGAQGPAAQIDPARTTIVSPLLGTFYRRSGPAEDPFVEVGSEVGAGSVVCIVEVMKMMNSIQAGVEGRITEVLVEDGQLVESGTELFVVEAL